MATTDPIIGTALQVGNTLVSLAKSATPTALNTLHSISQTLQSLMKALGLSGPFSLQFTQARNSGLSQTLI